jgi:glycosyltransferase involved in cell wall biosynthesis
MKSRSILLVGDLNSTHFQSWVRALCQIGLFEKVYIAKFTKNKLSPLARDFLFTKELNLTFLDIGNDENSLIRKFILIRRLKAKINELERQSLDVVHFFNFQDAGYKILSSSSFSKFIMFLKENGAKVYLSSYGSDLTFYLKNSIERRLIHELLKFVDHVVVESKREIGILKDELHFSKEISYVKTNGIGISNILSEEEFNVTPRNLILVKGNFGFVGRPFSALDLILKALPFVQIKNFKVIFYSVPAEISKVLKLTLDNFEIDYKIYSPLEISHEKMFFLFRNSRIYIGCSLTDGLSTSAVEAASQGAAVFQTDSSSIGEHVEKGLEVCLINLYNLDASMDTFINILNDDKLYKEIAINNLDYIRKNFSYDINKLDLKEIYK